MKRHSANRRTDSASLPRRNSKSVGETNAVVRLLQSNAGIQPVTPALLAAAEQLQAKAIISFQQIEYVRCVCEEDLDYSRSNQTCSGRCSLHADLDENANDYRCPDCDRVLYPFRQSKRRFTEIRAIVLQSGVERFIQSLLANLEWAVEPAGEAIWRVKAGLGGVHVCVADYCDDQRTMSVQWAQQNPTCYVAIHPRALERFAEVEWLEVVMLADLLDGEANLGDRIRKLAEDCSDRAIPPLLTPVYSKGAHRPEVRRQRPDAPLELFVIEFGPRQIRISGVEVTAAQAAMLHQIMYQLMVQFNQDLLAAKAPQDFACRAPHEIANSLQKQNATPDAIDADVVRRAINRLQVSIEDRLREAGIAAERDDIIQTSPGTAKEGYRLNPFKVAIRPLVPPDSSN